MRDGEPVLHVALPREVTAPEEFEDVDLVPAGDRQIVPTGLAPFSEVLRSRLGLRPLLSALKRDRRHDAPADVLRPSGQT